MRPGVGGLRRGNRWTGPFVTAVTLSAATPRGTTMGLLDRLFGRRTHASQYGQQQYGHSPDHRMPAQAGRQEQLPDDQAIARYRYLLRTAPPEQIEQAHAEAFAQLTVDQRQQVLAQLAAAVPAGERPRTDDPQTLARVATRAEMRQPGTLERTWSGMPAGIGMGGLMMGNFMSTIAGVVVGSMVADAFLGNAEYDQGSIEAADASADTSGAEGGDFGAGDSGFGDGGAFGDMGGGFGDFGGGDFGGGDFGGGDF